MKDESSKLTMPRGAVREKAIEIEVHTGTGPIHVPKTHDDFVGVLHLAKRHHPEHHKE